MKIRNIYVIRKHITDNTSKIKSRYYVIGVHYYYYYYYYGGTRTGTPPSIAVDQTSPV